MSLAVRVFSPEGTSMPWNTLYFLPFLSCSLPITYSFVVCLRFGCDSPGWKLKPTVPYQEVGTGADWHPGVWSGGWCQIHPPKGAALCSSRWNYSPVSPFFQDRGIFCWHTQAHTHRNAKYQKPDLFPALGGPEIPSGKKKLKKEYALVAMTRLGIGV